MNVNLKNVHIICFFFSSLLALFYPILPIHSILFFATLLFFINNDLIKLIAIFLIGYTLSSFAITQTQIKGLEYEKTHRLVWIEGTVLDIAYYSLSKRKSLRASFTFLTNSIDEVNLEKKIRVSSYDLVEIKPGERWKFLANLDNVNESSLRESTKKRVLSQGIELVSFEAKKAEKIEKEFDLIFLVEFKIFLEQVRFYLLEKINTLANNDPVVIANKSYSNKPLEQRQFSLSHHNIAQALIESLTIGYRANLPNQVWDKLNNLGISHLISISGIHISLFVLFSFIFVRILYFIFPTLTNLIHLYQFQAIFSLISIIIYTSITGLAIPALRSGIMAVVLLISFFQRKKVFTWRNYLLSLFFIVLFNPLTMLSGSFWLSFYAVFLIFLALNLKLTKLQQFFFIPIFLSVGIYPLQFFIFNQISVIAPLANLILVPLFSFICMPVIVLLLIFSAFPAVSFVAQFLLQLCLIVFDYSFQFISSIPSFMIPLNQFNLMVLSFCYFFIILIFIIKRKNG